MKCLIILFLFVGCADKLSKNTISNQEENIIIVKTNNTDDIVLLDPYSFKQLTNISTSSVSTNPTFLNSNSNYVLSYGITPNLYLLKSLNYNLKHYGYRVDFTDTKLKHGTISNDTYYVLADEGLTYIAIYYSPETHEYYYVLSANVVSNIQSLFPNINTNTQEPFYIDYPLARPETDIIYIADISTNQRVYYKPDNNTYLVKELLLIPTKESLYPFLEGNRTMATSNQNDEIFNIDIYSYTITNVFYKKN